MYLENDNFLTELTKLFHKSKASGTGTVRITMKQYDGQDRHRPRKNRKPRTMRQGHEAGSASGAESTANCGCLIRATLNNRKLSTLVHQKDVNRFQLAFSSLLKGNIDGLKKRDKKAATAAATTAANAASSKSKAKSN